MKNHRIRNVILGLVILCILGGLAMLAGLFRVTAVSPQAQQPLTPQQMQALIPRGRELALAGDCFGCHSLAQGPMGAGGLAIGTPFGTLYSTNITPDKQYGIGNYSRADYHRALRYGITPGNRSLYPAMPYVFSALTTPDDLDALYAYNMSLMPMPVPNVAGSGVFALPVRAFMNFWTPLNFPQRTLPSLAQSSAPDNAQRAAAWNRGAYLVEGLAHCGACHSPRNFMMGVEFSRALSGGEVDGVAVPNITAAALGKRGFDVPTLSAYLSTGVAPQGTSFDGMFTVTHFSTSAMQPADVAAMATYLLSDRSGALVKPSVAPPPLPQAVQPPQGSGMAKGRWAYLASCAGCHGMAGQGIPKVSPAMAGNATLAMEDPQTLIKVILNGVPTQMFAKGQRMYAMPPFAHRLDESTLADLITWIRAEWGGQGKAVTPAQVGAQMTPQNTAVK